MKLVSRFECLANILKVYRYLNEDILQELIERFIVLDLVGKVSFKEEDGCITLQDEEDDDIYLITFY